MFKRKPATSFTYLSRTCELEGNVHAEGKLVVDGIVHGIVDIQGDLEISKTGLVEGQEVRAHDIVVQGVLKARVFAEGKLMLSGTARLEGDVVAGSLEIEPGAYYTGYIETRESRTLPPSRDLPELYGTTEPTESRTSA
ncbi:polymer-forming cytoskeletal protein [Leptolyngbyaceae cyanobacterium CCMR0082]|uniref:Polymer-forming cytoskeletal protein n=2 Tax=Adonisia turfae TaxID=2950184 RepID=A0A6M0SCG7_9CYAN|nr:polymer-forming cytoskeletal protein [Adonisia turfae]MDV3352860.1 polymer-forming cytoskeletal protein [Leptothoe sp. LEGE 181152]NEZ56455.1 polymer-forming cytoskeletal protein [Adonisia turfae CCMR0081]NEZ66006.1 polymer-forming cytoskeletal protein [Adonisia turfae CCMR0082]